MKTINIIFGAFLFIALFTSCDETWEQHYNSVPETINVNLWEAVQANSELSMFVQYMKELEYDTLFQTNDTYTLFIPSNDAFASMAGDSVTKSLLDYHISTHFIQSGNIGSKRKIQTRAEKFALLEVDEDKMAFDGINIDFESPLYLNGKYFVIDEVGFPRPNLFEYYAVTNPILKKYIEDLDSIIIDKEESIPLGFDEDGNTIYDTVAEIYNEFEEFFFPIREEFRNKTATLVFPKAEDYNEALTEMAVSLGGNYQDYKDIPAAWQEEKLIPYLLERGVFENMLDEEIFLTPTNGDTIKMKNLLGDSVVIEYLPDEKYICSNGFAYNYNHFSVPDTLFTGKIVVEGEELLEQTGINRFSWNEEEGVNVYSDVSFQPLRELSPGASNDSIISVLFTPGYDGDFSLELPVEDLFPRKYLMVVRTHMYVGGIYDIFVNDELVLTIDYYDYVLNRGLFRSVTGKRYLPEGSFNRFDCWVESNADYGKAKVRFEYKGPGDVGDPGLVIDYIEFVPDSN